MNGEELKAAGQEKALGRAGSEWLASTLSAFRDYCERAYFMGRDDVTVDDFRATLPRSLEPASPNAWGAFPRAAAKAGYVTSTPRTAKAKRTKAHARVIRVWAINPAAL